MSRFTALPVGVGDAFLWQDGKHSVLVDGGMNKKRAYCELIKLGITSLDVIVCTHADADHTDGLIAIIESSKISVGSVWVPARWGNRLKDLVENPQEFLRTLVEECEKSDIRVLGEEDSPRNLPEITSGWERQTDDNGEGSNKQLNELEAAIIKSPDPKFLFDYVIPLLSHYYRTGVRNVLWLDAAFTASRIWKVVKAALTAGIEVKWFEHGRSSSGGFSWLLPVNSAEVFSVSKSISALQWLHLSRVNREALVFVGKSDASGSVLFCSDSPLEDSLNQVPKEPLLVTAPHHGSQNNAGAYARLTQHSKGPHLWVRSDGASKSRPCAEFTNFHCSQRACTTCFKCRRLHTKEVVAQANNGKWRLLSKSCIK